MNIAARALRQPFEKLIDHVFHFSWGSQQDFDPADDGQFLTRSKNAPIIGVIQDQFVQRQKMLHCEMLIEVDHSDNLLQSFVVANNFIEFCLRDLLCEAGD
jgi:hypothetical protein